MNSCRNIGCDGQPDTLTQRRKRCYARKGRGGFFGPATKTGSKSLARKTVYDSCCSATAVVSGVATIATPEQHDAHTLHLAFW